MPFTLTDLTLDRYYLDEFEAFLIYGPLGYGKSSYSAQVVAEAYGIHNDVVVGYDEETEEPYYSDWEAVKRVLKFHPVEVMDHLLNLEERDITMIWDDAGLWLYALDWNHPFVKAFGRYLNVARTDLGSISFTTPSPTNVMKKVRDLPQCRTIKIIKRDVDNPRTRYKARIARIFQTWMSPDMSKSGVKETHTDTFNAYMPDPFYEWYAPRRDEYAKLAKAMINKEVGGLLDTLLGKGASSALKAAERISYKAEDMAIELIEKMR